MKADYAICLLIFPAIFGGFQSAGQPSYYDSKARQTAEYKNLSNATNRAYSVPDRPSSSPAPNRSSSPSSPSSSGSRSSSSSTYGTGNTAPAYSAPAKVEKTNAEIIAEHNAWLRKVREEEKAESNARSSMYAGQIRDQERREQAYATEQTRAPKVKALAADIEAKGFTPTEAFAMAFRTIPPVNGTVPAGQAELRRMQEAQESLVQFSKRRAAGSYGELSQLAKNFEMATITAINAQQSLAARFPEKVRETEFAELVAMPYIWGGTKTFDTYWQADRATEGEKREAIDRYRELSAKYPAEAKAMLESYTPEAAKRLNAALSAAN